MITNAQAHKQKTSKF